MKIKSVKFILYTIMLVAFSSCSKEEKAPAIEQDDMVKSFAANVTYPQEETEDGETKTYITPANGAIYWEDGDEILVTNGSEEDTFVYNSTLQVFTAKGQGIHRGANYSAIYPAGKATRIAGTSNFTLDCSDLASQQFEYIPDSEKSEQNILLRKLPLAAYAANSAGTITLNFKSICGVFRLSVKGDHTLKSIVFTSNNAFVTGNFTIAPDSNDNPTMAYVSGGDKTATLGFTNEPTQTLSASGQKLYLIVPAQTYNGGFSVKVNVTTTAGDMEIKNQSTTKNIEVTCSTIKGMKVFNAMLFSGGLGTEENPYKIATKEDLIALSNYTNGTNVPSPLTAAHFRGAYYQQTENINFTGKVTLKPICNESSFTGTYNGNGKSLTRFKIESDKAQTGLFGKVAGGTVKNLTMDGSSGTEDFTVNGKAQTGAVIGVLSNNGNIENCTVKKVFVTSTETGNTNSGGVVGAANNATIKNCSITSNSKVTGSGNAVGGIVGCVWNTVTIENCVAVKTAVEAQYLVGGIVGKAEGEITIKNCYSNTNVTATGTTASAGGKVGGILGGMYPTSGKDSYVVNCIHYFLGSPSYGIVKTSINQTTNDVSAGGIVGILADGTCGSMNVLNCFSLPSKILNTSDNTNTITGMGGIVGSAMNDNTYIVNCYSPITLDKFLRNKTQLSLTSDFRIGSIYGNKGTATSTFNVQFVFGNGNIKGVSSGESLTSGTHLFGTVPSSHNNYKYISGEVTDAMMKGGSDKYSYDNTTYTCDQYTGQYLLSEGLNQGLNTNKVKKAGGVSWATNSTTGGYLVPQISVIP